MITRDQIQESARKLIGAEWQHQGRSLDGGIDCIGGIIFIGLDIGYFTEEQIKEIDVLDYSRRADGYELLLKNLRLYLNEIPVSDAKEGDVLTFRMPAEQETSHVGTITRGYREYMIVHSLESKKTIEEPLRRWAKFITFAFRFKGIS